MITNEQGSAILIVLMVIVSVTIIGLSSLNITGYENNITGNFKRHEVTFNLTDGTVFSTAKLVSVAIQNNTMPDFVVDDDLLSEDQSDALFNELAGFDPHDYGTGHDNDITFKYGTLDTDTVNVNVDVDVNVDIRKVGVINMKGGAAEFALGVGGFSADTAIVYSIDTDGIGPVNSRTDIDSIYYKVIGPDTGL